MQAGRSPRGDLAPPRPGGCQAGRHLPLGAPPNGDRASPRRTGGDLHTFSPTVTHTHSQLPGTLVPSPAHNHTHTHTRILSVIHTGRADFCIAPHSLRVSVCLSLLRLHTPPIQALSLAWRLHTCPTPRCALFLAYTPDSIPPMLG